MFFRFLTILIFLVACAGVAAANPAKPEVAEYRITRSVTALDATVLQAEDIKIFIWGVEPARSLETAIELKALDMLDRMIGGEPVNCIIMSMQTETEALARCAASNGEDLAIALLQNGYAVAKRSQTLKSPFQAVYAEAQENARINRRGVWRIVAESGNQGYIPRWLSPYMSTIVPVAIVFGPLLGLGIVAFFMRRGLDRILNQQMDAFETGNKKERALLVRERLVLASLIEGELLDNISRIEAFLVIYREMLKDLHRPDVMPHYQMAGEMVHKHPALSRAIFEANMSKLSLLDLKLAGEISKLYSNIHSDPEYVTLEPTTPLKDAVAVLEKAIHDAEAMQKALQRVIDLFHAMASKQLDSAAASLAASA